MLFIEPNLNNIDKEKISFELSNLKRLNDLFLAQKDILLKHFNIRLMEISDDSAYILKLNNFLEEFNELFEKINTSITDTRNIISKLNKIKDFSGNSNQELKALIEDYNNAYIKKYPDLIECIIYITNFVEELFIAPSYEKSIEHRKSIFSAASEYNEKQSKIHEKNTHKARQRSKILDEFLSPDSTEVKTEINTKAEEKLPDDVVLPDLSELTAPIPRIATHDTENNHELINDFLNKNIELPHHNEDEIIEDKIQNSLEEKTEKIEEDNKEVTVVNEEPSSIDEEPKEETENLNSNDNIPDYDPTKSLEENLEAIKDIDLNQDIEHTNEEIDKFVSNIDLPESDNHDDVDDIEDDENSADTNDENEIDSIHEEDNPRKKKKKKSKKNKKENIEDEIPPQRVTKLPLQDNDTLIISEKEGYVYLPFKVADLKDEFFDKKDKYSGLVDLINKEYTIPISRYKNSVTSRFKEAYLLMINKERMSALSGLELGLELAFNYSLHPAIISACKDLDELDEYLDALESKDLSQFKAFKISFELMPK